MLGRTASLPSGLLPATCEILAPEKIEELHQRALFYREQPVALELEGVKKVEAPIDPLTHMPLPVLPPDEVPSFSDRSFADWHHHYHPSRDKLLTSINGLAVRHVRLQLLPILTHHNRYHSIFERPDKLPMTNEERFGQIILACAGYVPPLAIDVDKDDPTEPVTLTKELRHRLRTSGEMEVRGQSNISTFMKNHLVRQDFSHVRETIIEEFITTKNTDRKWFLGHWLLAIASEIAVEPVKPIYRQALDEGLLEKATKLPNLVKSHVNGRKISSKAIRALNKKLTKQRA